MLKNVTSFKIAVMRQDFSYFFDFTGPRWPSVLAFVSRAPVPIQDLGNISKPFDFIVWIFLISTIFIIALLLWTINQIYNKYFPNENLTKYEESKVNFFLYTFAKITEPDPLPWFPKRSAGKIIVYLWYFLSFMMILSYTCNLLAHMTVVSYEKPINTAKDVIENGKRVWIFKEAFLLR